MDHLGAPRPGQDLVQDETDINWLEFWPESEFRLEAATAHTPHQQHPMDLAGLGDYFSQGGSMLPQPHSGNAQQLGLASGSADPYSSGLPLLQSLDQHYNKVRSRPIWACRVPCKPTKVLRVFLLHHVGP